MRCRRFPQQESAIATPSNTKPPQSWQPLPIWQLLLALVALLGWTAFLFSAPTAVYRDVEVRVRNGSGVPFSDITIGDKAYGDLSPGADSDYLRLSEARGAGHVSLRANGRPLSIQPLGFQPGKALADGSYTYVLTISTAVSPLGGGELIADSALGYLDIEVKQDALRR